jgi:hypothetical protein
MKHKTSLIASVLLVVALTWIYIDVSKRQAALLQDMVELDRSYIPAFLYTGTDDLLKSRQAIAKLDHAWELFKHSNIDMNKLDPYWDEDMDKVEGYIRGAEKIVKQGENLRPAHESLEHIRDVMLEVRVRNDMDYFLDYLTQFHSSMEKIVLTVKGKTATTLSNRDMEIIELEIKKTELLWQDVMSARADAKLFGFSKQQLKNIETLKLEERDNIEQLQQALAAGDKAAIIKAGLALKPVFVRLFKMFGDFSLIN